MGPAWGPGCCWAWRRGRKDARGVYTPSPSPARVLGSAAGLARPGNTETLRRLGLRSGTAPYPLRPTLGPEVRTSCGEAPTHGGAGARRWWQQQQVRGLGRSHRPGRTRRSSRAPETPAAAVSPAAAVVSPHPGTAERRPPPLRPQPPSPPPGPARASWARLAASLGSQRPAVNVRWVGRGAKRRCLGVRALMREETRLTRFEAFRPSIALPAGCLGAGEEVGEAGDWADSWGKGWVFLSSEDSGRCLPVCSGICFSGQPSPSKGTPCEKEEKGMLFVCSGGGGGKHGPTGVWFSVWRTWQSRTLGLPRCPPQPREFDFDLCLPGFRSTAERLAKG